jgi:hypothetical protein
MCAAYGRPYFVNIASSVAEQVLAARLEHHEPAVIVLVGAYAIVGDLP